MQFRPSPTLRRVLSVAACATGAILIAGQAQAAIYSLSGDFSDVSNPNGPWSFTQGATVLAHHAQPGDGNAANVAAGNGFYGAISNFSRGPFLFKATEDGGGVSGYNDGDFLTGDVVAHGTNVGDGADLFINWTAPTAGLLSFTSSIWYAHSVVNRSGDVEALLDGLSLGSVTVNNTFNRSNALTTLSGSNLAVAAGDVLSFRIAPSAGQPFGTLTGISATVDFTAAGVVPEPSTWAVMIVGFGMAGGVLRSRRRVAAA